MATWLVVLISVGILAVLIGVSYVVFRWGMKKKGVSTAALGLASAVFSSLHSLFPDDPNKLDVHDFMGMFNSLSAAGLEALKLKEAGKPFVEARAIMLGKVKEIVAEADGLEVSEEVLEEIVDRAFAVIGYF